MDFVRFSRGIGMGEGESLGRLSASEKGGVVRFEVHAKPRAKRSALVGVKNGTLEVSLAAPPAEGQANEELIRFLAEQLGLPKRAVRLVRGQSSRSKLVDVEGMTLVDVCALLEARVK
jgi:uncharacterized protein (TIGR00251 family)